jgi:hypothetical protein
MPLPNDPAYEAMPLHDDCEACHALARNLTPEETVIALVLFLMGNELEVVDGIYRGLCFHHRRQVDVNLLELRAKNGGA